MTEWFFVSAWTEKNETEIHFEIANEDGEQYFFAITSAILKQHLPEEGTEILDRFYYAEEDMLSLAVMIIDEEMVEMSELFEINRRLFEKYYAA